jgi:hypothetical protein
MIVCECREREKKLEAPTVIHAVFVVVSNRRRNELARMVADIATLGIRRHVDSCYRFLFVVSYPQLKSKSIAFGFLSSLFVGDEKLERASRDTDGGVVHVFGPPKR